MAESPARTIARTLAAYERAADVYARDFRPPSPDYLDFLDDFVDWVGPDAEVLEIGSGTGHDADLLEAEGVRVWRSDAAPAFVRAMRARGLQASTLNVLSDDLDGPWDGIYANAVLLHLSPDELAAALERMAAAVAPGGALAFTLREGDGAGWDTRLGAPRHFTYWREAPLLQLIAASPWDLVSVERAGGPSEPWLRCLCGRSWDDAQATSAVAESRASTAASATK
ncbi:MAG TPA: methyltransferase domain-containing protein [Solirubrobacteraceae bacterium]|nr:methyltransferase domain-containing protein [Solirubrobacteraceae bacterium]